LVRTPGGAFDRLIAVESTRYPDGARLEFTPELAATQVGDDAVCVAHFGSSGEVTALDVAARLAPAAPPAWFAELRESAAHPPAVSLVAFAGHGQARGALLEQSDLSNIEVGGSDQIGALRWYPATGEVDQIYVQPAWRRRGIATVLLTAGATLAAARGWPRFWSDGQRTAMGEQLRNARSWRERAADLTHLAPPMTPGESTAANP
jgi:GNAT superfamily N-acetyltransferase